MCVLPYVALGVSFCFLGIVVFFKKNLCGFVNGAKHNLGFRQRQFEKKNGNVCCKSPRLGERTRPVLLDLKNRSVFKIPWSMVVSISRQGDPRTVGHGF